MSCASSYLSLQGQAPVDEEIEVRCAIQKIPVEHRAYTADHAGLWRCGMRANHKRMSGFCTKIIDIAAVHLFDESTLKINIIAGVIYDDHLVPLDLAHARNGVKQFVH
jgi:hypothetical protein